VDRKKRRKSLTIKCQAPLCTGNELSKYNFYPIYTNPNILSIQIHLFTSFWSPPKKQSPKSNWVYTPSRPNPKMLEQNSLSLSNQLIIRKLITIANQTRKIHILVTLQREAPFHLLPTLPSLHTDVHIPHRFPHARPKFLECSFGNP
jgi:hypothetical protein